MYYEMLGARAFSRISRSNVTHCSLPLSKLQSSKDKAERKIYFSSSTSPQLSRKDLVRILAEKEELLKMKQKEIDKMQGDIRRNNAKTKEMEEILDRAMQEAASMKKVHVQQFGKSLLDVSDSLKRAYSACIYESPEDAVGTSKLVKMLSERIEMVWNQLREVLPESVYHDDICQSSVVVKKYNPRKVGKYNPKKVQVYNRNAAKSAGSHTVVLRTWTH